MLISLDIDLAAAVNMEDLTFPIGHDRGNWRIYELQIETGPTNLPYYTGSRLTNDMLRSWPHRAAVYRSRSVERHPRTSRCHDQPHAGDL